MDVVGFMQWYQETQPKVNQMKNLVLTDDDGDEVTFEWLEGSGMGIFSAEAATAHYGSENMIALRDWLNAGIAALEGE